MEYRRRHSLLAQKFRRFHLFLQIRRADHEIRLVGEKQLLVNGFARSVIHQKDVLRGEAPFYAFPHGDIHPAAGGLPHIGEGGKQHRDPLGLFPQGDLLSGGILKGIIRSSRGGGAFCFRIRFYAGSF